jgi:Galactose oxidase, central domain
MPDLSSQLREYFDATAPPQELDTIVTGQVWVESKRQTRRWGLMVPAWAYGLGALVLVLVVALGVNLLLAGDQNEVVEPTPTTTPDLFTEIAPGEMVELPDWPLNERTAPPMVWTGVELIVWGEGIYGLAGDGAAFDLANGAWSVIAEAPISPRAEHAAVWTGTEMILWGGRVANEHFYRDGAAYDPSTDTWRLLPSPPIDFNAPDPSMLWTGTRPWF